MPLSKGGEEESRTILNAKFEISKMPWRRDAFCGRKVAEISRLFFPELIAGWELENYYYLVLVILLLVFSFCASCCTAF